MFTEIQQNVQKQLKQMTDGGGILFRVEPDRDKVWETYLNAFEEQYKQGNNCNCCKSFLRQYAGVVSIKDGKKVTLWDFSTEDSEYKDAIKALKKYIHSLPIKGIFLNPAASCGTAKNRDMKRDIYWNHFHVSLPSPFVRAEVGPPQAAALDNKNVLERSLNEITDDAVNTTLELIDQNSLYRGSEFKGMLTEFSKIRKRHKETKDFERQNFYWSESVQASQAVTRIRNSAIGTLLNDLSEGKDLDAAVSAFERVVAPTNYKRPTALATPKMIEAAKKRLEELGLIGALKRRVLSTRDLNVNNSLFVYRASKKELDIFDELKKETVINPKTLSKVEEITIKDFVEKVLPTTKSVRVLLENGHFGNFASLVGPQNADDPTMFKWGNNISWSYSGEAADSVREKVKAAGGNVNGLARVSLSWQNTDDLDIHLIEPNGHKVFFGNKRTKSPTGAELDTDSNGGDGIRENPVENIFWTDYPKIGGLYKVVVNQYSKRQAQNQGFEVECDFDGQIYNFYRDVNGLTGHNHHILTFSYNKKDGFKIVDGEAKEGKYVSKEKWGLKSGQFHKVKAICLSPNFWSEKQVGNKHYFFLLENCKSEDKIRGFYNEFLDESLMKDRKVFEMLASKIEVESTEDELSGVGFSETAKNSLILEVEGSFKRTIKLVF